VAAARRRVRRLRRRQRPEPLDQVEDAVAPRPVGTAAVVEVEREDGSSVVGQTIP
jgi:hypothetical protein